MIFTLFFSKVSPFISSQRRHQNPLENLLGWLEKGEQSMATVKPTVPQNKTSNTGGKNVYSTEVRQERTTQVAISLNC